MCSLFMEKIIFIFDILWQIHLILKLWRMSFSSLYWKWYCIRCWWQVYNVLCEFTYYEDTDEELFFKFYNQFIDLLFPYRNFDGNLFICNCHLAWLSDWLRREESLLTSDGPKCHAPLRHKDSLIRSLPTHEFRCTSK